MLPDVSRPPYLPHLRQPGVLAMGLAPLGERPWIETDTQLPRYHAHKLRQRRALGERVYRALPTSRDAQLELSALLRSHLCDAQARVYARAGDGVRYLPTALALPGGDDEPLWRCSLWVADDLLILQAVDGQYLLTAASLCSPSEWLLEEKFGRPLAQIHAPIPGFDRALTPQVERFFRHLKVAHPVLRYNWSLQAGDQLCQRPREAAEQRPLTAGTPLYYRVERQSLRRLPRSGAVVFTIRVYLHPLESLRDTAGALPGLWRAIDATPPALARYKGFERLAPALRRYRDDPRNR